MFNWNTQTYIEQVEKSQEPGLVEYQQDELDFIKSGVKGPNTKTFIDIGAGYGRVIPAIAALAKDVIAVEQDQDFLSELQRRATELGNVTVISGSADELDELLSKPLVRPVLLCLQNTLGPWDGNREVAIEQMRKVASENAGEVIISIFCREAIRDWGLPMYETANGVVGNYDANNSDLDNGIFRSDTGYETYWFSKAEREQLKQQLGGVLVGELEQHKYHIFHLSYGADKQL